MQCVRTGIATTLSVVAPDVPGVVNPGHNGSKAFCFHNYVHNHNHTISSPSLDIPPYEDRTDYHTLSRPFNQQRVFIYYFVFIILLFKLGQFVTESIRWLIRVKPWRVDRMYIVDRAHHPILRLLARDPLPMEFQSGFEERLKSHKGFVQSVSNELNCGLKEGEGLLTLEYIMSDPSLWDPQAGEITEQDFKRDRAKARDRAQHRDLIRERNKAASQIKALQVRKARLDEKAQRFAEARKKGDMSFQADPVSDFVTSVNEFYDKLTTGFMKYIVDPESIRDMVAVALQLELMYRLRSQPYLLLRCVLIFVERMTPRNFREFAPFVTSLLRDSWEYCKKQATDISDCVNLERTQEGIDEILPHLHTAAARETAAAERAVHSTVCEDVVAAHISPYVPGPHDPPLEKYEEQTGPEIDSNHKLHLASVLLGSDAMSVFKKLTGVVVALGMLPRDASLGGLKLFTKNSAAACESIEDVFTILVTSLDYCLKVGRKYLTTGDWKDLIYEDALQSVQGRMAKCLEIRADMHCKPIDLHAYDKFINDTVAFIKTKVKAETKPGQAILLRHVDQLSQMKIEVQSRLRSFSPTKACTAFNVHGGSSVGKSSVVHIVSEVAAKALGFTSFKDTTTVINSAAKHDDSFYPNTECVYEDDVNAMQQAVVDNPQGINLMDLVNNWKKFCNKADLDSKGLVMKDAKFYICSSNSLKMFLGAGTMNLPAAAFRRIYALETKVKKEAQDTDGSLNGAYVADRLKVVDGVPSKLDDGIWQFTLRKWDFRSNQYMPLHFDYDSDTALQDPTLTSFKVEDVDLTVVMDVIRSIVKRNDSVQEKVVEFLASETPNCEHNNYPELCKYCSPQAFEARKDRMKPVVVPPLIQVVASQPLLNPQKASGRLDVFRGLTLNVSPTSASSDGVMEMLSDDSDSDIGRLEALDLEDTLNQNMRFQTDAPPIFPPQAGPARRMVQPAALGRGLSNFGSSILDGLSWRTKCTLMYYSSWLWLPYVKIASRADLAAKWKLRVSFILTTLFASIVLYCSLCCRLGPLWYLPLVWLLAFVYLLYALTLMSIRCLCIEEASHFNRSEFASMLEGSVEVVKSWRWQILSLCVTMVLTGLMLSKSFDSTLEEQNGEEGYKPPFKSQQAWMKKEAKNAVASPQVSGATVDQVLATVAEHSAYVTAQMDTGVMSCRGFCVGQGMWVINAHFLLKAENRKVCWRAAGNLRNVVIAREDWVYAREGSDIAVVHIRFPAAKDLSKFITSDIPTGDFPSIWMGVNKDGSAQVYEMRSTLMPERVWRTQGTKGSPLFASVMPVNTKLGMCGATLLAVSNKTASIIGIHALGATGTPHAGFAAFNAFDIASAVSRLSQGLVLTPQISELTLLGSPVDLSQPVPMKSAVFHLDKGGPHDNSNKVIILGGTLLGEKTTLLRGKTKESPIYDAVVAEFGEPDTRPCKYGQPEHISSQKALYHSSTDHLYDRKAYACALADVRKFYLDKAKSGMFCKVRPYTIEEAIQGLDERGFVNGLNWTSSMGMPWGGSKSNHSYIAANGKRMLNPEFIVIIEDTLKRLRQPNASLELIGEFKYKDEATKLVVGEDGKVRPKDSRVYTCYPVIMTVIIFMYFGPFGEVMNYNASEYGAAVPLNMCSHDAKLVVQKAMAFDPYTQEEVVIDGDFEHFDQSSTPELTVDTMSIDTECSKYSRYTDGDRAIMDNIVGDMSFPVEIVNGVAVVTAGMNTSGHSYTIHSNNKNCRFYLGYGFYAKYLRERFAVNEDEEWIQVKACGEQFRVPAFSKLSTWFTQGDDHIGTIVPYLRQYYNMETLKQELGRVNIGYTDASKAAVNKEGDKMYSTLGRSFDVLLDTTGAEFLKRRFVKTRVCFGDKVVDTVTAPIARRSITKSLYWKGTNEVDHEWVESVVHGQCREAALYGEEVYCEFVSKLERVLKSSGKTSFASPLKSFEEQMQHYAEAICECYVARDLSRDMVEGMPVFHYEHEFAPRVDLIDSFVIRGRGVSFKQVEEVSQELFKRSLVHLEGEKVVVKEWDLDIEADYLANFPNPKDVIKTSLHKIGSALYVPPPAGR